MVAAQALRDKIILSRSSKLPPEPNRVELLRVLQENKRCLEYSPQLCAEHDAAGGKSIEASKKFRMIHVSQQMALATLQLSCAKSS